MKEDCFIDPTVCKQWYGSAHDLVPGVPLINGVIDIVEGHILIGCSRLINALLLIICIAIGLSATLLMVKDGLL